MKKSIKPKVPGGVSHAAMRLARTEINNAYHAQSIDGMEDEPWVIGVEWNLTRPHHPDPGEICDNMPILAYSTKTKVPLKPHPNCVCYITPVLEDFQIFAQKLKSGAYDNEQKGA